MRLLLETRKVGTIHRPRSAQEARRKDAQRKDAQCVVVDREMGLGMRMGATCFSKCRLFYVAVRVAPIVATWLLDEFHQLC